MRSWELEVIMSLKQLHFSCAIMETSLEERATAEMTWDDAFDLPYQRRST
jgi:hypothetical protein